jgi:hypothetical protein
MRLSDTEFRACRILLAFARMGANFDHMAKQMRREGIPEETWRPLGAAMPRSAIAVHR